MEHPCQVDIVADDTKLTRDNILAHTITITNQQGESHEVALSEFATLEEGIAANTIIHKDSEKMMTISAEVEDGYNNALISRTLLEKLNSYEMPEGYSYHVSGELENIDTMLNDMMLLLILGFILIYLIMVAQFQSLLSPFIIILTVPLAFTGGFMALWFAGEPLSMLSLMGFAVLMGTVVNNGIVFVDYVNQLRRGGLSKRDALVAAGQTRMRPYHDDGTYYYFGHVATCIQYCNWCFYGARHGSGYCGRFALCNLHDALYCAYHVRHSLSSRSDRSGSR